MIATLNTLKDTWIHTACADLIKKITRTSTKIRVLTKHPPSTTEDVIKLVDNLCKISQVEENVVVFADAVDHITPQMRTLSDYSVPWSDPSIISMIDALDSLKDTWIHTTQDDLIKEINRISKKIRASTKCLPTAEHVIMSVKALGEIPPDEENIMIFATAVEEIISLIRILVTSLPWSDPLAPSVIGKLHLLKDRRCNTEDDIDRKIAKIVEGIRTLTKRPSADDLIRMVKNLGTIPQVTENVEVFINGVDLIVCQVAMLTNCSSPWSEAFITSIIGKLNSFRNIPPRRTRLRNSRKLPI